MILTSVPPFPPQVTLAVMKKHSSNAAVLQHACRILTNLAFNADNKVAIAAAGGIEVLIAAFGLHFSDLHPTPTITAAMTPAVFIILFTLSQYITFTSTIFIAFLNLYNHSDPKPNIHLIHDHNKNHNCSIMLS